MAEAKPMFGREKTAIGGVFTSDKAKLQFGQCPDGTVTGVLVQGFNFTYSQQITRLYEIGTDGADNTKIYYVGGRTQGAAQFNRVIGPNASIVDMYACYGNVCRACGNHITLQLTETDCSDGIAEECDELGNSGGVDYVLRYAVITQVGVSLTAQDMIINETVQLMFSGLTYQQTF